MPDAPAPVAPAASSARAAERTPVAPDARRRPTPPLSASPYPPAEGAAPAFPDEPVPTLRERVGLAPDASFEDVLGGRVLAWVGGLAVFLGIAFLLAIAVARGWIGEEARTVLAALASGGLLAGGVRLHERGARTDAARAMAASGIAALFLTTVVAARVYHLVPAVAGAGLAVGVGGVATVLAIRWRSRGIAALGILGAIAAPILADSWADGGALAILLAATAAAAGVLLWQRWNWLALASFGLAAPQWIAFAASDGAGSPAVRLAAVVAFGLLGVALAVGHDLRVRAATLGSQPALLLALNVLAVGLAGAAVVGGRPAVALWLAALAVAHALLAASGEPFGRVSGDLRLLSASLAIVFTDVAFGLIGNGPVHAAGWAATTVAFAALQRRARTGGVGDAFLSGNLGVHLALTLVSALVAANPHAVLDGAADLSAAGAASVAVLAAACLVSGRLVGTGKPEWRYLLDGLGLAAIALLTGLSLDGPRLVLAWLGEALVLGRIARRSGDRAAAAGALGFLALCSIDVGVSEVPPAVLVNGLAAPLEALGTVGGTALVAVLLGGWLRVLPEALRRQLRLGGAIGALYLASALVVTPFGDGGATDVVLGSHQDGQLVLSVFWALLGIVGLLVGLRRDLRALRLGAFALLGVAVAKVFLLDLATLTSIYRVASFVGLGLLLLAGAFVWQRLRPAITGR
jgi:uncharacterized membrane protein